MNRPIALVATLLLASSLVACTSTPSTPAGTATAVMTAPSTPSATRTPAATTPAATSTSTPTPGATGYRLYLKECDGTVKRALDVPAADHQYGPIHVCRPTGNIGVSAFNTIGESSITWVR